MPVTNTGPAFPAANVQFEHDEGPHSVSVDLSRDSTAVHEVEIGHQVGVSADHSKESTNQFEQPGPEHVYLEGYELPGRHAAQSDDEQAEVETKVVKPPAKDAPAKTEGAETK